MSDKTKMTKTEAKEIRTEAWAGKLVDYAEGADTAEDVQRSKLKVVGEKMQMLGARGGERAGTAHQALQDALGHLHHVGQK